MRKQPHSLYFSFLLITIIVNLIVYFQFTESIAHTSSSLNLKNIRFHNGDLVLRNSKGLLSSVFRNSSLQEKQFTHAGFLYKIKNEWFVYHFIDDNKSSGLHIEALHDFIANEKCTAYAFYRYQLKTEEQYKLESIISSSKTELISFDSDFDLATDSSMYCSEWIAKTLSKAVPLKHFIPETTVGTFTYIAPDNLYLNTHCKLLYKNEF